MPSPSSDHESAGLFEVNAEVDRSDMDEIRLTAFSIGVRRIAVTEILDRWPAVDHTYIKLIGDDGALYILRNDRSSGSWHVTLFQPRCLPSTDPGIGTQLH